MRCTDIELNFEWGDIPHTYVLGAESTILYGYGVHPSQPPQRELRSNGTAYAVFTSPVECLAAARELTCPQPLSTFVVHEDMSAIRLEGLMSDFWYREKPFDETYGPYWDKNCVNAAVYQASRNLSQTDGTCLLFAMTFLTNLVANMRYYDFMLYKGEPHDEHCFEHITSLARGIATTSHGFLYTEFSCAFSARRTLQLIDQGYAIQVKLYTGVSFPVTTDTYEILPVPHSAVFLRTNTSTYAVIDQNGARVIENEKLNELLYDNMRHSNKNTCMLFGVRGDSSMFKYNAVAEAIMHAQSETLIRLPNGNETDMSNVNSISKLPGTTSATFDVTRKSCYGEIAMFILTNENMLQTSSNLSLRSDTDKVGMNMLSFVLPDISLDKEPDATEIATALHESLKTFAAAAELDAQGNPPKEFDEKTLEELRQIDFSKVNVKCCPAESGHIVAFIW